MSMVYHPLGPDMYTKPIITVRYWTQYVDYIGPRRSRSRSGPTYHHHQ